MSKWKFRNKLNIWHSIAKTAKVLQYVVALYALKKKGKGMKFSLPPKLVEKLICVPVISFSKILFPVTHLMAYYAKTGHYGP